SRNAQLDPRRGPRAREGPPPARSTNVLSYGEQLLPQVLAPLAQDVQECRDHPARAEPSGASVARTESEDGLDDRLTPTRPFDDRYFPDDAPPVAETSELDDDVDRRRNLRTDVRGRQIHVRHHRHRLQAPQEMAGRVRVRGA